MWSCENADKTLKTLNPPLTSLGCSNLPWEEVALDIMRPVTGKDDKSRYVIVLVDLFTRWIELKAVDKVMLLLLNFLRIFFLEKVFRRSF